jgi:hypothetical protein
MIRKILCATGLLLLASAPAHALYNSKGSPKTGSAGLDDWVSTHKAGWGHDTFDRTQLESYSRSGSISYQGKSYGIQVEGGFNPSGTSNDRLAISWGEVGKKSAQGFLGGAALGAIASPYDPRAWGVTGLAKGLIDGFMNYWDQLERNSGPFQDGSNQSNTNCPCNSDGTHTDTGSD